MFSFGGPGHFYFRRCRDSAATPLAHFHVLFWDGSIYPTRINSMNGRLSEAVFRDLSIGSSSWTAWNGRRPTLLYKRVGCIQSGHGVRGSIRPLSAPTNTLFRPDQSEDQNWVNVQMLTWWEFLKDRLMWLFFAITCEIIFFFSMTMEFRELTFWSTGPTFLLNKICLSME